MATFAAHKKYTNPVNEYDMATDTDLSVVNFLALQDTKGSREKMAG